MFSHVPLLVDIVITTPLKQGLIFRRQQPHCSVGNNQSVCNIEPHTVGFSCKSRRSLALAYRARVVLALSWHI